MAVETIGIPLFFFCSLFAREILNLDILDTLLLSGNLELFFYFLSSAFSFRWGLLVYSESHSLGSTSFGWEPIIQHHETRF